MKKLVILGIGLFALLVVAGLIAGNDFGGTDGKIGEIAGEYAKAVGVEERDPFINTDQGDLLLFLFGLSGAVVGFYLGYQWRNIFGKGKEHSYGS